MVIPFTMITTSIIFFQRLLLTLMFLAAFTITTTSTINNNSKFTPGQKNQQEIVWFSDDETFPSLGIINGNKVSEDKYHFVASLQMKDPQQDLWGHICGGSILNDEFILTAAHCCFTYTDKKKKEYFPLKPEQVRVAIGRHNLLKSSDNLHFPVTSIYPHSEFQMEHPDRGHDLAVYRLAKKINFKDERLSKVEQICLPPSEKIEPKGEDCVVMGWGQTSQGDQKDAHGSMDLLEYKIGMLSKDDCDKQHFAGYDPKKLICASQKSGGACNGDSGGVYFCPVKGDTESWLQYGIVSFGGKNCSQNTPSYYTRVSNYVEWIKMQVGDS